MIHETEYFETEQAAQNEGERLYRVLYGYSYSFKVYKTSNGLWALESTRYNSCD